MAEKRITISTMQLKQIARYEITFRDLLLEAGVDDVSFECPEAYTYTLDDLYQAIKAIQTEDPTVEEFGEYWFYPITQLSDAFGLDRAMEIELMDDRIGPRSKYPGLVVTDGQCFQKYWTELEDAWEDSDEELRITEVLDLNAIIRDFDGYLEGRNKPVEEREFPRDEMKNYIWHFDSDQYVKEADETNLSLARKFLDILCDEDDELALRIKGYACYGGSRLYPCDWIVSRDCMIRLFEKTDDPGYANTLGYIYYYGRCSDGVPEYDKAFYYFGIAAANGIHEGMYKLADMFSHGYGCKESKRTASSLYGMVYEDSIKDFLADENASFADAALRMGNVYAKGIGSPVNNQMAYYYYLQADYAAKLRAVESDFFGNTTVVINTQKALEETEKKLPKGFFAKHVNYQLPFLFSELIDENSRCVLAKHTNESGRIEITANRIPTRSVSTPRAILITIPQLKLCEKTTSVTYSLDESADMWFKDSADEVKFDFCAWNDIEGRYEFFYDDEMVAWTRSTRYRIEGRTEEETTGPEYRLVSVRFGSNGRTYDYICDDPSVQAGDIVIVEGYSGETEVEVINVVIKRESELGLPVDRYKKILRKK